jgi:hypothetical protein
VAKQVLRTLDLAALAVALDRAEDEGLLSQAPDPEGHPADSIYLKYVGPEQLGLLSTRLPHVTVQLRTPGGAGNNKKLHVVFHRPTIRHVLGFLLAQEDLERCTRALDTVDRKYWKVIAS